MKIPRALAAVLAILAFLCPPCRAASEVRIVTSFYPMYIAAINVTKNIPGVTVENLTPPYTGCLHDYQMTTTDMVRLSKADILLVNGAGAESFIEKAASELPGLRIIEASKGLDLLKSPLTGIANPHPWLSPTLHAKQVIIIGEELSGADPARAEGYRKNAREYAAKVEKLAAEMKEGLKEIKARDIITFHEAFPYFAKEFGLNIAAVIEREPGVEPGAAELAETIRTVRRSGIKALFAEPQYPAKAAEAIAAETGAKVYILDPLASGPMTLDAYFEAMRQNLKTLREALK